ncbi:MAG: hypothetical protein KNN13_04680 [Hydrogenobacter thermophilus]|uniref:hypothetical protein n=1 Tax=Hydrogenobacter thermophilus TaxID=940 RepID=UPI001C760580|nr:hypothetical protein [Hydrogenobacter thermophilus]QWK20617.1 MAG: hypothetical protein KNN13_04680 [Hydrogenobacter thermophilus]
MGRNRREYNEELVKRGEILIDPSNLSPREEAAIHEGLARELFGSLGLKVPI